MTERNGIIVTNKIPNARFLQPLSPEDTERVKRIRWQFVLAYNRARSMPRTLMSDTAMAQCEEAIAIIDNILAAQPSTH